MRAMRIACFRLIVAGYCCFSGFAAEPQPHELKKLRDTHNWFRLRETVRGTTSSPLNAGAVASAFNEKARAEKILLALIRSNPKSVEAYEAYDVLANLYMRTGRYRQLMAIMEKRWRAFPDKPEIATERAAVSPFRGMPDQTLVQKGRSTFQHEGNIFLPVSIGSGTASYFFDTGANMSCMSASETKRLGLIVTEPRGTMGTSTGVRVPFRTAVAKTVSVGNMKFRNVTFAVFPDDQEPWSVLKPGQRGIIGMPMVQAFETIRWSLDGTTEVGSDAGVPVHQGASPNLAFVNSDIELSVMIEGERAFLTLDTGAQTTDLYQPFAKAFPELLSRNGRRKDSTEVRGVGKAQEFESVRLPELLLNIGSIKVALRPVNVIMKDIGKPCCVGNIGMDVLRQASAFSLDFRSMMLALEPKR